jgi:hypothetical protein
LYGTGKLVEGGDVAGRRLFIIEDVITSGGQVVASAKELRNLDGTCCLSQIMHRPSLLAVEIKELPGRLIRKKFRTLLGMETKLGNPPQQQTLICFSPR